LTGIEGGSLREKGHNGEEAIGVEEEPCYGTEVGGKK